jgi:hypothetical protein
VALHLEPRRPPTKIPQATAAAAAASALLLLLARRAIPLKRRARAAVHQMHSTEMIRRPDTPKGAVDVSAVPGVVGVESMLHTPGTPAPTNGSG